MAQTVGVLLAFEVTLLEVTLHPHAESRLELRGVTEQEVSETVQTGETFPAKYGRIGFRRNFSFHGEWLGRRFETKQVEVYAVIEDDAWLVISFITRYF